LKVGISPPSLRLRQELRTADVEIEHVSRRHHSDANMVYQVASLLGADLRAEAEAVLATYGTGDS